MGKILLVASGKGGAGKTSLSAGVGAALAQHGLNVLIIDADIGTRNLDLVLGMSDRTLFTFEDVCMGRVRFENAAAQNGQLSNLRLLTAPDAQGLSEITAERIQALTAEAKDKFDWTIIDCAAGFGHEIDLFAPYCSQCVIVSTCDSVCLRCAEKMVSHLAAIRDSEDNIKLVVNRINRRWVKNLGKTIDDAMDITGLPLLGVIPEDSAVSRCAEEGSLLLGKRKSPAAKAMRNIALRICGEYVPLSIG